MLDVSLLAGLYKEVAGGGFGWMQDGIKAFFIIAR